MEERQGAVLPPRWPKLMPNVHFTAKTQCALKAVSQSTSPWLVWECLSSQLMGICALSALFSKEWPYKHSCFPLFSCPHLPLPPNFFLRCLTDHKRMWQLATDMLSPLVQFRALWMSPLSLVSTGLRTLQATVTCIPFCSLSCHCWAGSLTKGITTSFVPLKSYLIFCIINQQNF